MGQEVTEVTETLLDPDPSSQLLLPQRRTQTVPFSPVLLTFWLTAASAGLCYANLNSPSSLHSLHSHPSGLFLFMAASRECPKNKGYPRAQLTVTFDLPSPLKPTCVRIFISAKPPDSPFFSSCCGRLASSRTLKRGPAHPAPSSQSQTLTTLGSWTGAELVQGVSSGTSRGFYSDLVSPPPVRSWNCLLA